MNDLERFFANHQGNLIHKWEHYFPIYERHFARFRGRQPVVIEFGVSHGGSLQMWKDYFGPGCRIYGVDINPQCKALEEKDIKIFIGDEADPELFARLREEMPPIDVLIDDGSHINRNQIAIFKGMFGHIQPHGVYVCEDVHTSYWRDHGGGYRRRGTFIEYAKGFVDELNAWHSRNPRRLAPSAITRSTGSVHFYDSVVVIEKEPRDSAPTDKRVGFRRITPIDPRGPVRRWMDRYVLWRFNRGP